MASPRNKFITVSYSTFTKNRKRTQKEDCIHSVGNHFYEPVLRLYHLLTIATMTQKAATNALRTSDMKMNKKTMTKSRRRVQICEQQNQELIFDSDLTEAEHSQVWYSLHEFDQMKDNRIEAVRKLCGAHPVEEDCPGVEHTCFRGLELFLPGGKQLLKRRHKVLRSIIKMYHQMQSLTPQENESQSEERENVLRAFCLSKTRYAQHTANYLAAQDAAAVHGACNCKQSSFSIPCAANQKIVTRSAVKSRRSLGQRHGSMRAMTA